MAPAQLPVHVSGEEWHTMPRLVVLQYDLESRMVPDLFFWFGTDFYHRIFTLETFTKILYAQNIYWNLGIYQPEKKDLDGTIGKREKRINADIE